MLRFTLVLAFITSCKYLDLHCCHYSDLTLSQHANNASISLFPFSSSSPHIQVPVNGCLPVT